ncbi:hypothetical protein ACQ4PT_040040 [Festuca glaucescens]
MPSGCLLASLRSVELDSYGVRAWSPSNFYAKIRAAGFCLSLGTFASGHDAAAWHLGLPRRDMNLLDVNSHAEAEMLVPLPRLVMCEEKHRHHQH